MAGLTQRSTAATREASKQQQQQYQAPAAVDNDDADGKESPRSASPPMSDSGAETKIENVPGTVAGSKGKSLKERGQIPYSFFVTLGTIFGLQYFSGMWRRETLDRWLSSLKESAITAASLLGYTRDLARTAVSEQADSIAWTEYARTSVTVLLCLCLFYVFVVAPARAGFWTGRKSRRHRIHRYMGLSYLAHYTLAWIEFFTNYEASRSSYLVHIIAVNGTIFL